MGPDFPGRGVLGLAAIPAPRPGGPARLGLWAFSAALGCLLLPEVVCGQARPGDTPPPVPAPAPAPAPPAPGGRASADGLPGVFGPDQIPLGVPEEASVLGQPPRPDAQTARKFGRFVERVIDPEQTFDVIVGRARLLVLKERPIRSSIEDTEVARVLPLLPEKQISINGVRVGTTVLNLLFGEPEKPETQTVLSYLVRVLPDPEARQRLERVYEALAGEINRLFPNSVVRLSLAGDKVVVTGQAKDIVEAAQILRIVAANATGGQGGQGRGGVSAAGIPLADPLVTATGVNPATGGLVSATGPATPTLENYRLDPAQNVVNLLRVPGEQQVMLRVTVAEIDRAAARSIGVDFTVRNRAGNTVFSSTNGLLTNSGSSGGSSTGGSLGGGTLGGGAPSFAGANNLNASLDNGRVSAAIAALRTLSFARTLAEPNLTTTNGQPASFQAGGRFPVPIVSGATLTGLQGVSFVPFGVQLNFTPYVTDKDRIRLVINSEVSVRDLTASASVGSTTVPGLTTRNFQTTVELREGQTLAVAGLIQNSFGASGTRVPFFGDLPFVGRLAGFDTTSYSEQELVVLVTPELVHPYEPCTVPALPGSDLFEPDDLEFFLLNRLESRHPVDFRSTVRTDFHRMIARYRTCQDTFIQGPSGHSDGRR